MSTILMRVCQGGDKPGPYPTTKKRLAKPYRVGAGLVPALVE